MERRGDSLRLYLCGRCRAAVTICSRCDRGQRYCGKVCAAQARLLSVRAANRRHQASFVGALNHAQRQSDYRRLRKKVTHQGSLRSRLGAWCAVAVAVAAAGVARRAQKREQERGEGQESGCVRPASIPSPVLRCCFCGAAPALALLRSRHLQSEGDP